MLSMKIVNDLNMSDTSFKMLINSFNFVEEENHKEPVVVSFDLLST